MEIKKPIGILYDSVSNNTGDIAVGIALSDYLKKRKIPHRIVDPFDFSQSDYEFLIIGGGFLIRDEGDFFYDAFRANGNHVLNSTGTYTFEDLSYLKNYRKISVRSENDRNRILENNQDLDVEVVPCITLTLEKSENLPVSTKEMIGVHFVADTLIDCDDFEETINSISGPKAVLPFTFYNNDLTLMKKANLVGDYAYLDEYDPKTILGLMSEMKAVIVSSLHATIFAYSLGIPFITMYQGKVQEFLDDRGLGHLSFKNTEELQEKLALITETNETDLYSEQRKKDLLRIDRFFDEIFTDMTFDNSIPLTAESHLKVSLDSQSKRNELESKLTQNVLNHRDELLGTLIQKNVKLKMVNNELSTEIKRRDNMFSMHLLTLERKVRESALMQKFRSIIKRNK